MNLCNIFSRTVAKQIFKKYTIDVEYTIVVEIYNSGEKKYTISSTKFKFHFFPASSLFIYVYIEMMIVSDGNKTFK